MIRKKLTHTICTSKSPIITNMLFVINSNNLLKYFIIRKSDLTLEFIANSLEFLFFYFDKVSFNISLKIKK